MTWIPESGRRTSGRPQMTLSLRVSKMYHLQKPTGAGLLYVFSAHVDEKLSKTV